jgi:hypothetical protein
MNTFASSRDTFLKNDSPMAIACGAILTNIRPPMKELRQAVAPEARAWANSASAWIEGQVARGFVFPTG